MHGAYPQLEIDHINGDGLDNRIDNLREVSRQENARNMKLSSASKTGVCGVYFVKKTQKWRVRLIMSDGRINKKVVSDFFEACCMRKSFERKNGFHINHGSPRFAT